MMTDGSRLFEAGLPTPLTAEEAQAAARETLALAQRLIATPEEELASIENGVLVQAIKLLAKVEATRSADPGTVTAMKVVFALANPKEPLPDEIDQDEAGESEVTSLLMNSEAASPADPLS